jgi:hypothetical protein
MRIKTASFQLAIALSAFLLFLVQPIIAKQILPWFGGSASVWNTCLFFFQFLLLLGYVYAHALTRWATVGQQAFIHVGLLALSLVSLPVIPSPAWKSGEGEPALRILLLLSTTLGLPYFLLATTSPLLQAWYFRLRATPYRLFALSNAASLAGLSTYPFILEPNLTTTTQATLWSAGFVVFGIICAVVAILSAGESTKRPTSIATKSTDNAAPPTTAERISWMILAGLGSLALVSVTSFVARNIVSMPLIWVVPLAIYLMTFIMAFGRGRYQGWPIAGPALIFGLVMAGSYQYEAWISLEWSLPVFMAGLFCICLYCHGELAASKPDPIYLTTFYILVALGGALGSLAGSVLAPLVLNGDFEMLITLTAIAAMFAWQRRHDVMISRALALGLAVVTMAISVGKISYEIHRSRILTRNFYSALRIVDVGSPPNAWRRMEHGGIEHGSQYLDLERRREPISYYGRSSGVALALARQRQLSPSGHLAVGIVGLGAGAIAAYGESGDRFRFYEINPQVLTLAHTEFTYLSDSQANVSVALGDARLVLEREAPQAYDALIVDAFSGDAIPIHLLTREAVQVYRNHLTPSGVLLFHISNRFVDLQPALARLAVEEGLDARYVYDDPDGDTGDDSENGAEEEDTPLSVSTWVLMAADKSWMSAPGLLDRAEALEPPQPGPAWTDDFNNILSAIRVGELSK